MSRLTRVLKFIEGRPELVIEVILATILFIFAIYLGGPWYVAGPTTVIGNSIEAQLVRTMTASIYIVPAVVTLFGVFRDKPKLRLHGNFGVFMAYLFTVLLRWLTVGFTPLIWLHALGLALIAGVVYIVESRRTDE